MSFSEMKFESCCSNSCLFHKLSDPTQIKLSEKQVAFCQGEDLFIRIFQEKRSDYHVLGSDAGSLPKSALLKKIMDSPHKSLMRIKNCCDCMFQTPKLNGEPLFSVESFVTKCIPSVHSYTFLELKQQLGDLSNAVEHLHRMHIAHGDLFPFNILICNGDAVLIDYENISNTQKNITQDKICFIFNVVFFCLIHTDTCSQELIRQICKILKNEPEETILVALHALLMKDFDDLQPSDGQKTFNLISEELRPVLENRHDVFGKICLNHLIRFSLWYYSEALTGFHQRAYLFQQIREERLLHRLQEHEMRKLMVPVAEYRQLKSDKEHLQKDSEAKLQALNNELMILKSVNEQLKTDKDKLQKDSESKLQKHDNELTILKNTYETPRHHEQQYIVSSSQVTDRQTLQKRSLDSQIEMVRSAKSYLQMLKTTKSMRAAKMMAYANNTILHAPSMKSRIKAIGRLLGKMVGTTRVLSSESPFEVLSGQLNQLEISLSSLKYTHAASLPTGVTVSEQANTVVASDQTVTYPKAIPPAVPKVFPYTGARALHGKRKVAILTNQLLDWQDHRPRFGGGERYALNIARLLQHFGFEVHFYQVAYQNFVGEYYGFPVFAMPVRETFSEFHYATCDEFLKRTMHYDHVYYNMPEYSSGTVRSDGIMTCHGIWFDHNNAPQMAFRSTEWFEFLGRIFSSPRRIVSVDTNSINVIRSFWPELASKMRFIPSFVDDSLFFPKPEKRNPKRLRVLFPRRSQINRGSRILADILKRIPHDVDFYWVGEGDAQDTEIIRDLCKKDSRLSYYSAEFNEMPSWYQRCDIAVIPTIACEGTSLSCVEAMACGCATICTNVGGLTDLVFPGHNGFLCDPTAEALSGAINKLIEDPVLLKEYQEKAICGSKTFSTKCWQKEWTRVLLEQDWISEKQALDSGFLTPKDLPSNPQNKFLILTRNAIHGGVESIIREEAALLPADVIVCGGHDYADTCPFSYRRADDAETLRKMITPYTAIIYHWIPDYAVEVVRESGIPSFEFIHRTDTMGSDKNAPTALITHSCFLAEYVVRETGRPCTVVEHPINTELFVPGDEKEAVCIGALTSYYMTKGIDFFLKAWAPLKNEFADVPVRFYGAGNDLHFFKELAKELGIQAEFRPATLHSEKALREFRCFVAPSRIEGLPMAILEALAANIPVVAFDLPGMKEFSELAERRGYSNVLTLVKEGDIAQLTEAIRSILHSRSRTDTRKYIQEYYSPKRHCGQLKTLFNHL